MNYEFSKITDVEFDGIDHTDMPDYSDAFITAADYDGVPMTDDELEDMDSSLVYELLMEHLH